MISDLEIGRDIELKRLFPRRKLSMLSNFYAIIGPYGYIRHDGGKLGVVLDLSGSKRFKYIQSIMPEYNLVNDGEYLFRLDFSDTNRALDLVGFKVNWRR